MTCLLQSVVTYRYAYINGEVSLCDLHSKDSDGLPALGPVSHGRHDGICELCQPETDETDAEGNEVSR